MRKFLVNAEEVFGAMIQLVLWVALFGLGMKGVIGLGGTIGGRMPDTFSLTPMSAAIEALELRKIRLAKSPGLVSEIDPLEASHGLR